MDACLILQIKKTEQAENYILARLAWQAWCPWLTRSGVGWGQGNMGPRGEGEEGWPSCHGQPGISKLPPRR